MKKLMFAIAVAAAAGVQAQERAEAAPAVETQPAVAGASTVEAAGIAADSQAQAETSAATVAQEAAIVIDADEKVQEAFDEFAQKKSEQDGFPFAWGRPNAKGIMYFCKSEAVTSKSASDPDFLKKRQMAYARAFQDIRSEFLKYNAKSFMVSGEEGSFLHDGDAYKTQLPDETGAVKRLGEKIKALTEAKVDAELQKAGVDPSKFDSMPKKRKALSRNIIRKAVYRSLGSCTGISVVKTVEGKGTDGQYSIGVIAKYDPEAVVIADCMARKVVPAVLPKQGIPVGKLLASKKMTENFGTRFYYDETGMPALLSFGQWSSGITPKTDRYERKLLERSAFIQAEAQANIDMSNFIAGHMTFDEIAKAGESYEVNVVYSDDGVPVDRQNDGGVDELASNKTATNARDGLAGRSCVFAKTLKHPDTGAMITVVAVNWSFRTLEQVKNRGKRPAPKASSRVEEKEPVDSRRRDGDTYDF